MIPHLRLDGYLDMLIKHIQSMVNTHLIGSNGARAPLAKSSRRYQYMLQGFKYELVSILIKGVLGIEL